MQAPTETDGEALFMGAAGMLASPPTFTSTAPPYERLCHQNFDSVTIDVGNRSELPSAEAFDVDFDFDGRVGDGDYDMFVETDMGADEYIFSRNFRRGDVNSDTETLLFARLPDCTSVSTHFWFG